MTKSQEYRIENDSLGQVKVPIDALWQAQTQRSLENFPTGSKMPLSLIRALLLLKKTASETNYELKQLEFDKAEAISKAVVELLRLPDEQLQKAFPLSIYQTGSGTQTNMNVNEVIATVASRESELDILPNDDVNCAQSSNDIFPTAMNIVAVEALKNLENSLHHLIETLRLKQDDFWTTLKVGRTHLQDATPITFGQELSGYISALKHDLSYIEQLRPTLYELAIGGTAVGTGLNASPDFSEGVTARLADAYGIPFSAKSNKFFGLAHHSGLNVVHGAIETLAADLLKIANDIRFLASGPRAGYGELKIPANEPGSSIMPGKINPTQAEALTMAVLRVFGNDTTIGMASSQGNFEMNVYKPVLIASFLESAELLTGTITAFTDKMIAGLTVNSKRMEDLLENSLMTVTALSPHIGYHAAAEIAQKAERENTTLRSAALASGLVNAEDFEKWMDLAAMTNLERSEKE
ncbi:MAG: class II fumarate hydratase [Streptococcaceae bacterium]|jgi:fumarate hydratase class II|nr:class II fumarate hydratase [Streptococcaceae bacterium]